MINSSREHPLSFLAMDDFKPGATDYVALIVGCNLVLLLYVGVIFGLWHLIKYSITW